MPLLHHVAHLRRSLGPTAPILFLAPARSNAVFLRQRAMAEGPWIRVEFSEPHTLVRQLARPACRARGLAHEPPGWLETVLAEEVSHLEPPWRDTLAPPGWHRPLARALRALEGYPPGAVIEASDHPPLGLLETLRERVDARREEAGFASATQVHELAHEGLSADLPCNRFEGVVLYGDRILGPTVSEVLSRWLASRTVLRLRPDTRVGDTPSILDPDDAPFGLQRAAPDSPLLVDERSTPSLTFARTPDDARECEEVVREALRHVEAGVPLTEIAIAVPDNRHMDTLRHALLRANLPATFLVGPPLTTTPAATFLQASLDLAEGPRTAERWYRYLTLPGLRLRAHLGSDGTRGKGRWRRLLRTHGMHRGPALLAALQDWTPDEDESDPQGTRAARDSLLVTLSALTEALDRLRLGGSWPDIAGRWAAFLYRWWPHSTDRSAVLDRLDTGGDPRGLSWSRARRRLAQLLDTPHLSGSLADRAIRVAAPMNLLGGRFRVVLALGLSDGRFPVRASEDPFLPDRVLAELEALGPRILPSRTQVDRERRRLVALVSSCTESLWLSSPAMDMGADRPLQPSPFLLDLRRARGLDPSYAKLEHQQVAVGSRSEILPPPTRALDAAEHRAARILDHPDQALPWLATHPVSRRLLEQALGEADDAPNRYNGLVTAPLPELPGRDDDGASPFALQFLLVDPERYLLRYVLGIWGAQDFPTWPDPLDKHQRRKAFIDLYDLDQEVEDTLAAWDEDIAERFGGSWPDGMRELALALGRRDGKRLHDNLPDMGPSPELSAAPVHSELPWTVRGAVGFTAGNTLFHLDAYRPKKDAMERPALLLYARALGAERVEVVVPFGRSPAPEALADHNEALDAALKAADQRVQRGYWPKETP